MISSLNSWYEALTWPQAFLMVGGAFVIVLFLCVVAWWRGEPVDR